MSKQQTPHAVMQEPARTVESRIGCYTTKVLDTAEGKHENLRRPAVSHSARHHDRSRTHACRHIGQDQNVERAKLVASDGWGTAKSLLDGVSGRASTKHSAIESTHSRPIKLAPSGSR